MADLLTRALALLADISIYHTHMLSVRERRAICQVLADAKKDAAATPAEGEWHECYYAGTQQAWGSLPPRDIVLELDYDEEDKGYYPVRWREAERTPDAATFDALRQWVEGVGAEEYPEVAEAILSLRERHEQALGLLRWVRGKYLNNVLPMSDEQRKALYTLLAVAPAERTPATGGEPAPHDWHKVASWDEVPVVHAGLVVEMVYVPAAHGCESRPLRYREVVRPRRVLSWCSVPGGHCVHSVELRAQRGCMDCSYNDDLKPITPPPAASGEPAGEPEDSPCPDCRDEGGGYDCTGCAEKPAGEPERSLCPTCGRRGTDCPIEPPGPVVSCVEYKAFVAPRPWNGIRACDMPVDDEDAEPAAPSGEGHTPKSPEHDGMAVECQCSACVLERERAPDCEDHEHRIAALERRLAGDRSEVPNISEGRTDNEDVESDLRNIYRLLRFLLAQERARRAGGEE